MFGIRTPIPKKNKKVEETESYHQGETTNDLINLTDQTLVHQRQIKTRSLEPLELTFTKENRKEDKMPKQKEDKKEQESEITEKTQMDKGPSPNPRRETTLTKEQGKEETLLTQKEDHLPESGTAKSQTQAEDNNAASAHPGRTSWVRGGSGEWKPAKAGPSFGITPSPKRPSQRQPSCSTPKTTLSQVDSRVRTPTTNSPGIVKPSLKSSDRVSEARGCLVAIKTNLGLSRNTKKTLVENIIGAAERLFAMVKECEKVKGKKQAEEPKKNKEQEPEGNQNQHNEKEGEKFARIIQESNEQMEQFKDTMKKHKEEQEKLIQENNRNMEKLAETIERHKETVERQTYASVAAATTGRQPHRQTALHSIVVSAKDETETGEEVLDRIRKTVNAKESGIVVEKIRKAKDRKVIVGCRTEEERDRFRNKLKEAKELNVENVQNKNPLVILKDVLKYNQDEDVLSALKMQNKNLLPPTNTKDMEIAYKKQTRNPHTHHIVLRVSPAIWKRLVEAETVLIDLQKVRVADQSPLVQCSLCLGYGHGRRFCKETVEKCSHCSGPHLRTECADWTAGAVPTCINCVHAKVERSDHNAFSSECPIRRRWDALARASVAYC